MAGTTATVSGSYIPGMVFNLDILDSFYLPGVQWDTFPLEDPGDYIKNPGACTDFPEFNEVYKQFFSEPYPARTTVGANLSRIAIEVDCVAILPQE